MNKKRSVEKEIIFTKKEAKRIGDKLKVNWKTIDIIQFTTGMNVELEHGTRFPTTNITDDDPVLTGKIALAHLLEYPDYYTRLTKHNLFLMRKKIFTTEDALLIGNKLGIEWSRFDVDQFRSGLDVELEHGKEHKISNVTNDDPILTGKIALAHLYQFTDYYTKLCTMEKEAEVYWESVKK